MYSVRGKVLSRMTPVSWDGRCLEIESGSFHREKVQNKVPALMEQWSIIICTSWVLGIYVTSTKRCQIVNWIYGYGVWVIDLNQIYRLDSHQLIEGSENHASEQNDCRKVIFLQEENGVDVFRK